MNENPDNNENTEEELYEHYRLTVDQGQSATRIDKYLTNRIENASRNRIQAAAEAGNIRINGKQVKASYKVKGGDEIKILMDYPRRELKIIPQDIPLNIIFEDDHLVVINKSPGMVVHPGHGNYSGTMVNALAWYYKDLPLFKENDLRPGLIHRIDKDTSGLIVVAKTEKAKNKLARQFYDKTTERRYQAIVWGIPKNDKGIITGNIGRSLKNRQVFTVFPEGDYGKNAVTHYSVLKPMGYVSLIECRLETGRTHQIRVHMKFIGHPVVGDKIYGVRKEKNPLINIKRQALHSHYLQITHPATEEVMSFTSPLPEDIREQLSVLIS